MPIDETLVGMAERTGIPTDKLEHEMKLLLAMPELFNLLEGGRQKVGLYGGTALNKIYYGKRQRLSNDLDIFCYSYKGTVKLLLESGAKSKVMADERAELNYMGIKLDLWPVSKMEEEPQKLQATSLLSYYGYPLLNQFVPSYSLEFLLARKVTAMCTRNLIRDIYDAWVGLQLVKDMKKFDKYLDRQENEMDFDCRSAFQASIMKNPGYYDGKGVDAVESPPAALMIKDIAEMLGISQAKAGR